MCLSTSLQDGPRLLPFRLNMRKKEVSAAMVVTRADQELSKANAVVLAPHLFTTAP
jgi:hypothetical protein